ncbi:transglycosylase SLT domain-containing protein, partial [Nocardia sp. NPDC051990]|uniref:transglycosylase SLT domain-containing protein n=1 Tax=Nocardia sp. NPDC051990 TaxID=3155285 RepID=UPI00342B419D
KSQLPGGRLPGGQLPGGTVGTWIKQALAVLQQLGYDISKIDPQDIAIIIQHESGGNPNAVNNWDSNAAAGTPSIGLMQTIGPTFNQYAAPGHKNIYNPVDNIVAGVRYAISRYGSVHRVPGVKAVRYGLPYKPY